MGVDSNDAGDGHLCPLTEPGQRSLAGQTTGHVFDVVDLDGVGFGYFVTRFPGTPSITPLDGAIQHLRIILLRECNVLIQVICHKKL